MGEVRRCVRFQGPTASTELRGPGAGLGDANNHEAAWPPDRCAWPVRAWTELGSGLGRSLGQGLEGAWVSCPTCPSGPPKRSHRR